MIPQTYAVVYDIQSQVSIIVVCIFGGRQQNAIELVPVSKQNCTYMSHTENSILLQNEGLRLNVNSDNSDSNLNICECVRCGCN